MIRMCWHGGSLRDGGVSGTRAAPRTEGPALRRFAALYTAVCSRASRIRTCARKPLANGSPVRSGRVLVDPEQRAILANPGDRLVQRLLKRELRGPAEEFPG